MRTDVAGPIDVRVRIAPQLVNLLANPRHALSSLIGKGLFTLLADLGFALDWHAQAPSCSRHYRPVRGVQVDEALFFDYHAGVRAEGDAPHCSDLKEARAASFPNAQHVVAQGQDVVLFSDTVLGTARTLSLTLFNPLEYPVLVRLVPDASEHAIPGFLPSNRSDCITIDSDHFHDSDSNYSDSSDSNYDSSDSDDSDSGGSAGAVLEGTIPSNGRLVLGPLRFAPTRLGVFSAYFMLLNNYTGLQPRRLPRRSSPLVLLAGRCVEQPILLGDAVGLVNEVSPVSPFEG